GSAQLGPSDGFEVSRGDAKYFSAVMQGSDQFADGRTQLRAQIFTVRFDLGTHARNDAGKLRLEGCFGNASTLSNSAQDANIGIAVHVDAVGIRFHLKDFPNGVQEGKVVDRITGIQERAVDVEDANVGVPDQFLSARELVDGGHLVSATIISSCVFYSSATSLAVPGALSFGKSCTKLSTTTRSTW